MGFNYKEILVKSILEVWEIGLVSGTILAGWNVHCRFPY
jgi:hypothetical protein